MRILARRAVALFLLLWAPAALAQAFLWEVGSLTNRVYLFGTVHAGKSTWYPLPAPVEEAFADSKVLVVEADITDTEAFARSADAMKLPVPDTLSAHVPPDEYTRLLKLLPRYGFTEAQVIGMKPFMAVSMLVFGEWARNGYLPQYGVENYLIRKAKAELKPVAELEGVDTQVALMQSLTENENRTLFSGTLMALESSLTAGQIKGMVAAWQAGDPRTLLDIARRYNEAVPGAKEFEEKFIWSRHDEMVKKIEGYLNDSRQRHFIAVGSLHLAGPRGLVEMLRARGYVVRQR